MRVDLTRKAKLGPSSHQSGRSNADARREITTPELLEAFLQDFYRDVAQDDLLGPLFNDVAAVDWKTHIPKIASFWNRFLFGIRGYTGNPMERHIRIHDQSPFTASHFERWLELFNQALDENWRGDNVTRMKKLASNIAVVHAKQLGIDAGGLEPANTDQDQDIGSTR